MARRSDIMAMQHKELTNFLILLSKSVRYLQQSMRRMESVLLETVLIDSIGQRNQAEGSQQMRRTKMMV